MIEIPLNSNPEQLFTVVINETKHDVRVTLNSRTGIWSIGFSIGTNHLISGVPLLPGVDIFEQHNLDIGKGYVVNLEHSNRDPNKTGLGTSSKLFILTQEEIGNGASV
jgi:hypothetical protein